jgi:hypothetical protein
MAEDLGTLIAKLGADTAELKRGLSDSRQSLQSFESMAQTAGQRIRQALTFTAAALGIYSLSSALKEFATSSAMVGARTETLSTSMELLGKNAGVSRETLDYFVDSLKELGITTQEAMSAVSVFLTAGLPLEKISQLADVARNQAVLVGKNTSETFQALVNGILSFNTRALREYYINVGNLEQAIGSQIGQGFKNLKEVDPVTKQLALLNAVLERGKASAGAYDAAMETVGKQMSSLARISEEAKNALWEFFRPIMEGWVQEMTAAWQDLERWARANQTTLRQWGQAVGEWVRAAAQAVRTAVQWIHQNWELLKTLGQFIILYKITGWLIRLTTAVTTAVTAIRAFTVAATAAQLAAGGWVVTLTAIVAALGALAAYKSYERFHAHVPTMEGAPGRSRGWTAEDIRAGRAKLPQDLVMGLEEKALAEARRAFEKVQEESKKGMEGLRQTGAAGAKAFTEELLKYLQEYLEAKRQLELEEAQESYETFRAAQDLKKAELNKALAEGLVTGREYHQALLDLAQAETDAALALIEAKIAKEKEAYEWAQKALAERVGKGEISPEASELVQQKLLAEHTRALMKLEGEAGRQKVQLAQEFVKLAQREYDNRRRIADLLEEGGELAAIGPLAEKEAEINRLLRERRDLREDLIRLGGTEAEVAVFDVQTRQLEFLRRYGDDIRGYADSIAWGFASLIDSLTRGGRDLVRSLNDFFRELFHRSLKPGLEQLQQWLIAGFTRMFGEVGAALGNAIMGVIGLIGMLLTGGGGGGSYSPAGVTTGVMSHEAVRGIIAGPTSIPIGQIGASLQDALVPTNSILRQIEANTRGGAGAASVRLIVEGLDQSLRQWLEGYFAEYYLRQS